MAAYDWTKTNIAPGFVKSSAEFMERNIGSPVATGLKRTGVEKRFRRYLKDRKLSDTDSREEEGVEKKRRRVMAASGEANDIEKGLQSPPLQSHRIRTDSRASSLGEALPAYDDNKSPPYGEHGMMKLEEKPQPHSPGWSTQVMITTSGLGAALSEPSLRSLKFCLSLLRSYTDHIADVMRALSMLLQDYERAKQDTESQPNGTSDASQLTAHQQRSQHSDREDASRRIAENIKALSSDIMRTIKSVIDSVSLHTGSALPANAGALVRRQLMSVPQRWIVASAETANSADQDQARAGSGAGAEAIRAGRHMLAFAKQGLDMIAQVSLVLSGTIESAENWLDRIGRRRSETQSGTPALELKDEKMGGMSPSPMEGVTYESMDKK